MATTLLVSGSLLAAQRPARAAMQFREIGPAVAGGRACCVAGVPGKAGVYYVGAAGGGVWKTSDGGFTWKNIFEHETTESIGAVALAPSNPELVWVGTGESNVRNDVIDGHGLFFSPDGGQTFTEVGTPYFAHAGQIAKIVISPANPDDVWVAVLGHAFGPNANRGVFRTTDGGATWQKVLYVNDTTGAIDLGMKPGNPRVLVAAMWQTVRHPWGLEDGGPGSGIYKSIDGGASWTHIQGHGLPQAPYGRMALAFAPSDPDRLYALIEASHGLFWRSDDDGVTWTAVSDHTAMDGRPFYFTRFEVMPNNADDIFFLSSGVEYSSDGGKTIHSVRMPAHSYDHHALWIDPDNPQRMIEGDDAGVVMSHDGGQHWIKFYNLPIEEGYSVHADADQPYHLCAGFQDDDAWCGPSQASARPNRWRDVASGDGEYAVPAPSDPNLVYADTQEGEAVRFDLRTGLSQSIKPVPNFTTASSTYPYAMPARFNWTSPIAVSATQPEVVYLGANRVYKSVNGGQSWTAISPDLTLNDKSRQQPSGGVINLDMSGAENADTILAITIAPTDPNTLWVGTDDGIVQVTHDGGKSWDRVGNNIQGLKPWGRFYQIGVSPFDADTAYVAYDRHEMNDAHPYVYKTSDGGKTWTEIDTGLPDDYVAHVVREDPNHKGLLVLGTDQGLYRSANGGASWTRVRDGFPTVVVYDLQFVKRTHGLVVCTHGRGLYILDNIVPWEQMANPAVASAPFTLFPVLNAVRFQRADYVQLNIHPLERQPPQPPSGAVIQYHLAAAHKDVKIAITDAAGRPVAHLAGSGQAGLNAVVWSGNYDASKIKPPSSGRRSFFGRGRRGLRALPGRYRVTVTVPGLAPQSQWVKLEDDPRFPSNPAALKATLAAAQAMQPDVDALNLMRNGLDSLHQQLSALQRNWPAAAGPGGASAQLDAAQALEKKVTALQDVLAPPRAQAEIGSLAGFASDFNRIFREISGGVNTFPRPQELRDWATARKQLEGYLERYNVMVNTDVVAFNRQALAHHAITLVAGHPVSLGRAPAVLTAATAENR